MNWKYYFKKEGGLKYLLQSLRKGTLFVSMLNFIFLGRDKKALELLRLSQEYKLLKKLRKQNHTIIKDFIKSCNKPKDTLNITVMPVRKIWICWWQGLDNAPLLVKKCFDSVRQNFQGWEIYVITLDNYKKYVIFPEYIEEKWKEGKITMTHMSDLLRFELLSKFGGLWLDATVYVTSPELPSSIEKSDLFWFKTLKPGADGHVLDMSSWMIYGTPKSPILQLTKYLLYEYWKVNNKLIDYFLVHYMMALAAEAYPKENDAIPQFSNSLPHILLLNFFEKYNDDYWKDLCKMTPFHKLSYKLSEEKIKKSAGSYFEKIIGNER